MKHYSSFLITPDEQQDEDTAPDYMYSPSQYNALLTATIITSVISMFFSLLIVCSYTYIRITRHKKANRVSLKCVFISSIMNMLTAITDTIIICIYGDTAFCRVNGIVNMFTRVMSASLLAIVGLNLVLVFVLNISASARKLESIYYPCAVIYAIIAIVIPIIETSNDTLSTRDDVTCYYFVYYYELLGHSSMLWMWFYGFLFFTIMIAVVCSAIALTKLMREHHTLIGKWITIASTSQAVDTAQSNVKQRVKSQSSVFIRVVSRCVMYPLVPFICNIWGFVFQLLIISPSVARPSYAISLTDSIFGCLQGFFVAIVFFSDPAMTNFMSEQWVQCKEKYIDDFSQIRKYSNGQIEIVSLKHGRQRRCSMATLSSRRPTLITPPSPAQFGQQKQLDLLNDIAKADWDKKAKRTSQDCVLVDSIPMRRMSVPAPVYTRTYNQQGNFTPPLTPTYTEFDTTHRVSFCMPDPGSDHRILVPYKHPRLAAALHWILVHCGFGRNKSSSSSSSSSVVSDQLSSRTSSIINIPATIHPLSQQQQVSTDSIDSLSFAA